jgi:hypothetical protein
LYARRRNGTKQRRGTTENQQAANGVKRELAKQEEVIQNLALHLKSVQDDFQVSTEPRKLHTIDHVAGSSLDNAETKMKLNNNAYFS